MIGGTLVTRIAIRSNGGKYFELEWCSIQLKLTILESSIFPNNDTFSGDLRHRLLHSSLMECKNKEKSDSRTSSKAITAFAIDGA